MHLRQFETGEEDPMPYGNVSFEAGTWQEQDSYRRIAHQEQTYPPKPETECLLFPNPSSDFVALLCPETEGAIPLNAQITDLAGKPVEQNGQTFAGNLLQWDVRHLPQGMYLVRIAYAQGRGLYLKFVKI